MLLYAGSTILILANFGETPVCHSVRKPESFEGFHVCSGLGYQRTLNAIENLVHTVRVKKCEIQYPHGSCVGKHWQKNVQGSVIEEARNDQTFAKSWDH